MDKNYISLSRLRYFLDKLKSVFASVIHTHNKTEIIDYVDPVKSDWNESDENSLSFIENRTHYSDIVEEVILEEQTISVSSDGGRKNLSINTWATEGEIVRVVFDGEIYDCEAFSYRNNSAIAIGSEDTSDVPFFMFRYIGRNILYMVFATAGDHTVSISRLVEDIHKLDPKYLPDGGVGYTEVLKKNIKGITYILMLDSSDQVYEHNFNIPFDLGQEWEIEYNNGNKVILPVKSAEDGTLHLGGDEGSSWIYVTKNTSVINHSYAYTNVYLTGVSGTYTGEPIIHQLDEKYIPSTISRTSDVETALSLKQDANQAVLFTEVQELTDEQKAQARNNISILNWKDVPKHNGIIKMADYSKALLENNNYAFDIDEAAQLTSVSNSNWTALAHIGYAADSLAKQATMTEFLVPNFMNILVANYEALNATGVIGDILYLCNGDNAENITVAYCITPHPNNSNYTHALHILTNNLFPFIGYIYYNKDTSDYEVPNTRNISTTLNKKNYYADDKAVGDALLLKADKTDLVQSDWSQNDVESLDYVKNRTHYEETVENLILEKYGLSVNTITTNGCYSNVISTPPSIPVVGEEYIVYWNNDKYTFIAKQYSDFLISIGNTDLLTGDKTKEPILIMFQVSGAACLVYSTSAIDVLNLKVTKQETIVHPIDPKYLPTSIQPDWAETDETSLSYIKNKPDENDALALVTEMGLVEPVAAEDGSIYTDENGVVYSL